VTDFYTVDDPNGGYDKIPVYDPDSAQAPYDIEKFRSILDHCNLQDNEGETVVRAGAFAGYLSSHFFAYDDILCLLADKKSSQQKVRTELREWPGGWQCDDQAVYIWQARLRVLKPKEGVDSYTYMQIHGTKDTFDYPLLRIMWVRSRQGVKDHLWAIRIVSMPYMEKKYEWLDLGKRPDGFFDLRVETGENRLDIYIEDKLFKSYDVTYWSGVRNYFKAGVYINRHDDSGKAAILFERLTMH
jgi:hypothetical protein